VIVDSRHRCRSVDEDRDFINKERMKIVVDSHRGCGKGDNSCQGERTGQVIVHEVRHWVDRQLQFSAGPDVDSQLIDARITRHCLWTHVDDIAVVSTTSPEYPQRCTPHEWIV
jgi:hypothetical protein